MDIRVYKSQCECIIFITRSGSIGWPRRHVHTDVLYTAHRQRLSLSHSLSRPTHTLKIKNKKKRKCPTSSQSHTLIPDIYIHTCRGDAYEWALPPRICLWRVSPLFYYCTLYFLYYYYTRLSLTYIFLYVHCI